MKRVALLLLIGWLGLQFLGAGEVRREIPGETALTLAKQKLFYLKDIRFCWQEAGATVCNDVDPHDGGRIYVTEPGILHRGKKAFLVRWQDIKKIASPPGSPDILRIYTAESTEKLVIKDLHRTGSTSTLDSSLDVLLRRLKKAHKKRASEPVKALPVPTPAPAPKANPTPPAPPKPTAPVKTKEIRQGMTPQEVEKIQGPPLKKILLEKKIIYQYKDLNLVFIDGKLKDVTVK